jgi:hypothetical protein
MRKLRNQPPLHQRPVEDASRLQLQRGRQGYTDARTGQGYPYEYDDWSEDEQLAYETGRLWLANLAQAALRPPAWRTQDAVPARLLELNQRAHDQVGSPVPLGRRPASRTPLGLEPMALPRMRKRPRR